MKDITIVTIALGNDGAERVLCELTKEWIRTGHKVTIIQTDSGRYGCKYDIPKDTVIIDLAKIFKNKYISALLDVYMITKYLNKNPNTVAISFLSATSLMLAIASLFCKNKIIMSERNNPSMVPQGKLQQYLRNIAFLFADRCVFQTEESKKYFCNKIQKKGSIIVNPIGLDIPKPFEGIRKKKIVTACRLHPQKNLKMMIDAFYILSKEFPEYTLYIYGQGILKNELINYTKKLGLEDKVFLPGYKQDVLPELMDASIYVSSSDYEGISNSMLEAMALGLPIVVTDCPVGGARMIVKDGVNGILIPVGDTQALYNGMKEILTNPTLSIKLSQNAIKIREKLDITKIIKQWNEII